MGKGVFLFVDGCQAGVVVLGECRVRSSGDGVWCGGAVLAFQVDGVVGIVANRVVINASDIHLLTSIPTTIPTLPNKPVSNTILSTTVLR